MKNAKEEFLQHAANRAVKCAEISIFDDVTYEPNGVAGLPVDYTQDELDAFLKAIDIKYNNGYGTQELFGVIWYMDGTYSTRWEYDGSEGWEHHQCPVIPEKLIKQ